MPWASRGRMIEQNIRRHASRRRATMRKILIATDGSPEAREAVDYGLELAEKQHATATLLQVIPPLDWTQLDRGAVIRPIPAEIEKRRGGARAAPGGRAPARARPPPPAAPRGARARPPARRPRAPAPHPPPP